MSEQPEVSAAEAAKVEAASQAVKLAFGVAGVLLMIAAQRAAGDPDFYRSLRMRAARRAERLLSQVAARCWQGAERARLAYDKESA